MVRPLNQVLTELKPSGIRVFARLAANTPGTISLTLGEPGEDTAAAIRACVPADLDEGMTHYAPNVGFSFLTEAIATYLAGRGQAYEPSQIIVTNGATEALSCAFMTLLDPGDEVIVLSPAILALYESLIALNHGIVRRLELPADHYQLDVAQLEAHVTPRTKAILLNSPNNPTGQVLSGASLDAIAQVATAHDLYVLCDDVYERLAYADDFQTFSQRHPALAERTIIANSLSKPWAMTGWRLGWLAASPAFIEQAFKVHQSSVSSLPAFTQHAAAQALATPVEPMRDLYLGKRDYVMGRLNEMGLACTPAQGAFYALPSIAEFGMSSEEFCRRGIAEAGVALSPGVFFGAEGYARISFGGPRDQLAEGLDRLARFVDELRA